MIKIKRGSPPAGNAMDKKRERALRRIREIVESEESESAKIKFNTLWSASEVKEFLYESQHHKCCYCERNRDKKEFDVEHFRPKGKVKEAEKTHPGYWWLAYDWENLLIACKTCNQKKSTHFPLKDEKNRAYPEDTDLGKEEPILINPLKENPELFIDYDLRETKLMVKAIGRCERGEKTVNKLTGINAGEVMLGRADKLKDYRMIRHLLRNGGNELYPAANKRLRQYVSPTSEFSGFAKFYFRKEGCLQ